VANVVGLLAVAASLGLAGIWLRRQLAGTRWRVAVDAFILAVGGLALAGVVAEVAARFWAVPVTFSASQYFEYRPGRFAQRPNQHWQAPPLPRWPGYEVRTNEDGLRTDTPRPSSPPAPDERRVVFFGDSFTFGIGLSTEQTYPAQAQELLRAGDPEHRWVTLNAGIPGANVFSAVDWFIWIAPLYRPQFAVFTVGEADDILPDVNSELRRREGDSLQALDRFALYRVIRRSASTLRYMRSRAVGERIAAGELPAQRAALLAELTESAALMAATARSVGCIVVFNRIVVRSPSQGPPVEIDESSLLYPFVAAGARVVDTVWDPTDEKIVIPDDGHPSPAGALLLARNAVTAIRAAAPR
jgi:lysophospholipase L1-like esterase